MTRAHGGFCIRASAFHTPERGRLEFLPDALIRVSARGTILSVEAGADDDLAPNQPVITLPPGQYLLPGMVDLHVHAPQWPQLGRALDVPLEEWLQRHTFPLEARYADLAFAEAVYGEMIDSLLAHGTTCAAYFGTIHLEATALLAHICLEKGQRALVGKVAMDAPGECPEWYRDADAGEATLGTRRLIERIAAMQPPGNPLVLPAVTPRFLPSCTQELLGQLGALVRERPVHIQTHCAESAWEVAHGQARFGLSDVEVLDGFGLLQPHTILAHGNFLSGADRRKIGTSGAAIAHCPLSNAYFAGRVLPAGAILAEGLHIGLGTDISGGHSPSLFDSARFAVTASRMLAAQGDGEGAITVADAFWMATAGGGEALGLPIGVLRPGFEFDCLAVDTGARSGLTEPLAQPDDTPEGLFEKIVRRAGRANIAKVWVRGREVSRASGA